MGAVVQYRDLPGGPTKLRLCDELSRHCMCTNCGMLSMSMLQDQNRHMFCETCLMERSIKYNSEHIYCSYENQQVDIFKMFDASDLITVIRDQFAECPNPECNKHVTLQELKEHYTKCKPAVMCSTCQQQVQSADWSDHSKNCNKQEAGRAQSMGARPKQFGPKQAVPSPKSSTSVKINSNQNSQQTFSPLYPSSELQEAQISTNDGPEKMTLCPHCERRLKERNLDRHFKACSKVPQSCCYCDGKFIAEEIKSHVAVCEKNPDRVLKQKPEKREAVNTQVVSGSQVSRGGQPTYASALKNGKPAEGNNSTITKPQPKGPPRKECAQVGHPAAKGASKSCPDPQRHKVPADSPIWLQLMSSGNLLAAFAAFEESCSEKKMSEELIYSQFTTRFVDTKYREMVKDLLEKPCPTQPLYCLMVALFTRACLPPNVWAKSEDKVTWKGVLKYLPSILVSRLKKRDVIAYLQTYPIFLDKEETSPIVEAHCSTKEHPSNTSHSSNSTHLAAPTKVADPLGTGKDGHDSSEMPQDISVDSAKREDERGDVRAKSKMSYSPATTAHSKSKSTCSPTRTSVESQTTQSQRAKLENKKSYPPNATTHPRFKWTSPPPKSLEESGTTNFQRTTNKQSCCPTQSADTEKSRTYEFPTRTFDQTETGKSRGEKGKSMQFYDNWRHSSTSTPHFLNKRTYLSAVALGEGETKSQGENVSTRRLSPHDSGIPVLHALGVPHQDIQAWFRKAESYFYSSRIYENSQKYSITSNSLTPQVQEAVRDILASPPKTHAYECLLISLFRRNMSALNPGRSKPIGFHTFVQQLPYELKVNLKSHCTETIANSACLCR